MRNSFYFLAAIMLLSTGTSCRRIKGNGNLQSENRQVANARKVKLSGSYDVEITQGPVTSVKVEADENILPFIVTSEKNGVLTIRSEDNITLSTEHNIKVYITTDKLEMVTLAGSGNITGKNKFTGGDQLTLRIAGSGDMDIEANTPKVDAEIAGSGSITVKGETKDQHITIVGSGNYNADQLKSENTVVKIVANGDAKVFADANLDINITGSGSVYYKGDAAIKQHIIGSGDIKKIQ